VRGTLSERKWGSKNPFRKLGVPGKDLTLKRKKRLSLLLKRLSYQLRRSEENLYQGTKRGSISNYNDSEREERRFIKDYPVVKGEALP